MNDKDTKKFWVFLPKKRPLQQFQLLQCVLRIVHDFLTRRLRVLYTNSSFVNIKTFHLILVFGVFSYSLPHNKNENHLRLIPRKISWNSLSLNKNRVSAGMSNTVNELFIKKVSNDNLYNMLLIFYLHRYDGIIRCVEKKKKTKFRYKTDTFSLEEIVKFRHTAVCNKSCYNTAKK